MNLSTVKWAHWDKTHSRELLGPFICVCTIVVHNIAQNRPVNFPSYPPDEHQLYEVTQSVSLVDGVMQFFDCIEMRCLFICCSCVACLCAVSVTVEVSDEHHCNDQKRLSVAWRLLPTFLRHAVASIVCTCVLPHASWCEWLVIYIWHFMGFQKIVFARNWSLLGLMCS